MNEYLHTLNEREKWMLGLGAFFLLAFVYFSLLYRPLANRVSTQAKVLLEKAHTLEEIKKIQAQAFIKAKKPISNNQLLSLLGTELKEDPNLNLPYQLQQMGTETIELSFDAVPFEFFLHWLIDLTEHYKVRITQLDAKPTETAGLAQLALTLSTE